MVGGCGCMSTDPPPPCLDSCRFSLSFDASRRIHAISITTNAPMLMTIPQYPHDIRHTLAPCDASPLWGCHTASSVESHQPSVRHPASELRTDGMSPFLQEHGSIRGEGPSDEERTPGRSGPLDLCSTEDHDHHLRNEAAAKVIISVRFGQ